MWLVARWNSPLSQQSQTFNIGAVLQGTTHRPLSSSSWGLPYRLLNINLKKELLRGLWVNPKQASFMGVRTRGTIGDIDPLNKVSFKRARSRAKKGPPLRRLLLRVQGPKP